MAEAKASTKKAAKKVVKKAAKTTVKSASKAKTTAKKAVKPEAETPPKTAAKPAAETAVKSAAKPAASKSIGKISVTLIRSKHGRLASHKGCVAGLGLRRMHQTVEVIDTPENRGMINKVRYLLNVEEA
jgi:large subunit ribosomal protein L30